MTTSEAVTLIQWIIEVSEDVDHFLAWYRDKEGATTMNDCPIREANALKPELVLTLLNYIRDQTTRILDTSQSCSQTPSKANHPSKYDYNSPVKKVLKSSSTTSKGTKLEDRFNNQSNKTRRSLDSSSSSGNNAKNGKHRSSPSPEFSLGDFIIRGSGKKVSQKVRKSASASNITASSSNHEKKKATLIAVTSSDEAYNNPAFFKDINEIETVINGFPTIQEVTEKRNGKKKVSIISEEKTNSLPSVTTTTTPVNLRRNESVVVPSIEEVTHKEALDKLIRLYCFCLDNNLVPNILVELYLLLELLTVQEYRSASSSASSTDKRYLDTVHNCVYFSTRTLYKQYDSFLRYCDRVTLRFLIDNPRVESFLPDLKMKLIDHYEEEKVSKRAVAPIDIIQSVRFQSDTDNRTNFPNNQSFQEFKKQRDLFYEILRIWEFRGEDSNEPWDFQKALGYKIETLLSMHSHPTNLIHFARLFQCQLVSMCSMPSTEAEALTEGVAEALEEMQELKKTDPVKYRKLQSRLTTPSMFGGPCPKPEFSGPQEFFRDFIRTCRHHQFLSHLKDNLSGKIHDLSEQSFTLIDNDNKELENTSQLQDEVAERIMTMRILAKFLGYIESLPYFCSPDSVTEDIVACQISVRKDMVPSVDITEKLIDSVSSKRLTTTIPWIVEYASMIDPLSVHLPYYVKLFSVLVSIYREILIPSTEEGMNRFNRFFLCINLGWLFENPLFPRELLIDRRLRVVDLVSSSSSPLRQRRNSNNQRDLDQLGIITQNLLYSVCPYLSEVKVILGQFISSTTSSTMKTESPTTPFVTRKIVPVTTLSSSTSSISGTSERLETDEKIRLQRQMEENFFHNQPTSVKRSVEFISERVASNAIKALRLELVNRGERQKAAEIIKGYLEAENKDDDQIGVSRIKMKLSSRIQGLAEESWMRVRSRGPEFVAERVREPITSSLKNLLAEDTSQVVLETSIKIAFRKTIETTSRWIEEHVAIRYFKKDYQQEFERQWRQWLVKNDNILEQIENLTTSSPEELKKAVDEANHEVESQPPSRLLIKLKSDIKLMLLRNSSLISLKEREILQVITDIKNCLSSGREDITVMCLRGFEMLTVDWILALISSCPDVATVSVQEALIELWCQPLQTQTQIMTILCPRNLVLLGQSLEPHKTWERMEALITRLLHANLLFPLALEDQCIQLLKQEWPQNLLSRLASCLQGVVQSWQKNGKNKDSDELEFVQLMEWIVWYCSSANDLSEDSFPEL